MKFFFGFITFVFCLFLFVLFLDIKPSEQHISNYQELELMNYVIPINSIAPCDTNFSDILFLKSVLKDKKILLLGESTHFDGATFLAKTRLIKFLHEQLDYDLLFWEAGFFDVWYMNEILKETKEFDPALAIYPFWHQSSECKDLWEYLNLQQKATTPIKLCGIDPQLTGCLNDSLLGIRIINFLTGKKIDMSRYRYFNAVVYKMGNTFKWLNKKSKSITPVDSILIDMSNIKKTIESTMCNFEDTVFFRYFTNTMAWINCIESYDIGDYKRFYLRDSLMANNLMWFIDQYYPEKKVIVWASNMHVLYNNKLYQPVPEEMNFVSMGEHIKSKYGDKCYAMVFSSFCRLSDRNTVSQKGGNKSIEFLLHKNKIRYGFLDFRTIPDSSFLYQDIKMRANHNYDMKGKWAFMCDGLFYIDTMPNVHY